MRSLSFLIPVLASAVGCVAVDLDAEQVCTESALSFAPAGAAQNVELAAVARIDLALLRGPGVEHSLHDPESVLSFAPNQLDEITMLSATVALDDEPPGEPVRYVVTDRDRASDEISLPSALESELLAKLTRGRVTIRYTVSGQLAPRGLAATSRTCVSSSTKIEKTAI